MDFIPGKVVGFCDIATQINKMALWCAQHFLRWSAGISLRNLNAKKLMHYRLLKGGKWMRGNLERVWLPTAKHVDYAQGRRRREEKSALGTRPSASPIFSFSLSSTSALLEEGKKCTDNDDDDDEGGSLRRKFFKVG